MLISAADGTSTTTGRNFHYLKEYLNCFGAKAVAFVNLFDECHCEKKVKLWKPCSHARSAAWREDPVMQQREIATAIAKFKEMSKKYDTNIFCGVSGFNSIQHKLKFMHVPIEKETTKNHNCI